MNKYMKRCKKRIREKNREKKSSHINIIKYCVELIIYGTEFNKLINI